MQLNMPVSEDEDDTSGGLLRYLRTPAVLAHLSSGEVRLLLTSPESGAEEEQIASAAVAELIRACHLGRQNLTTIPVEVSGLETTPLAGRPAEYVRLSDEYGLLIMNPEGSSSRFLMRLQQVAASLPLGVLIKDVEKEFSYRFWNRGMERLYALSSAEVLGKEDRELFEPRIAELARKEDEETVRRGGRPLFGKARSSGAEGAGRYVQHVKFLVEDDHERFIISFVNDVTRLVESRRALTEANNWKNLMLSVVSHDVLAPLQAMAQGIEELAAHHSEMDPENRDRALSFLRAGAEKSAALLEDVLLWSSSEERDLEAERELLDVVPLIQEVAQRLEVIFGITLELSLPDSTVVNTSRPALQTILRNLATNAAEHAGSGAQVRMSVSRRNGRTTLEVADTGPGIPSKYLEDLNAGRLPAKLQPGDNGRRGIGLQLCLSLAQRIGADLRFRVPPEGGTVATVEIGDARG